MVKAIRLRTKYSSSTVLRDSLKTCEQDFFPNLGLRFTIESVEGGTSFGFWFIKGCGF
jgi:hypothetical protein